MRRLRTAKDSVKGKPNALQGVMQLPVELLFDILELAHPMDLMHLSRTSKGLRKVVLSKSSEPVWKAAYKNYDELNNPPEDIPYPKWTAMMYDDARCDVSHCLPLISDFLETRRTVEPAFLTRTDVFNTVLWRPWCTSGLCARGTLLREMPMQVPDGTNSAVRHHRRVPQPPSYPLPASTRNIPTMCAHSPLLPPSRHRR